MKRGQTKLAKNLEILFIPVFPFHYEFPYW